jgi:hypothetical protein
VPSETNEYETVLNDIHGHGTYMAIDANFILFIIPALMALLAAAVALPSKSRIERDPSTAYKGWRRATVNIAFVISISIGVLLIALGGSLNLEPIFGEITMVHIGGISLIIMAVVLLIASSITKKQIKQAGRGMQEEVIEVAVVGGPASAPAPAPAPSVNPNLPPRPPPQYRPPPRDGAAPPPVPPRVPRKDPYGEDPVYEGVPPSRPPPRRGPPPG